jgi:hypothetical protein
MMTIVASGQKEDRHDAEFPAANAPQQLGLF